MHCTSFNIRRTTFTGNETSYSDQEIAEATKKEKRAQKKKAGTLDVSTLDEISDEEKLSEWEREMDDYQN